MGKRYKVVLRCQCEIESEVFVRTRLYCQKHRRFEEVDDIVDLAAVMQAEANDDADFDQLRTDGLIP